MLRTIRQRIFAYLIAINSRSSSPETEQRKQNMYGNLHGNILEIGPGSGSNLRFYAPDVTWFGLEPNPYMHPYLLEEIRSLGWAENRWKIFPGDSSGVKLPVPDGSMDAVVSHYVLCSVPSLDQMSTEILRVLKPGGCFVFYEHVAAEQGSFLRWFQDFIQPVWSMVGEGCHPNRETGKILERTGFTNVSIEYFKVDSAGPVSPHIAGTACKG